MFALLYIFLCVLLFSIPKHVLVLILQYMFTLHNINNIFVFIFSSSLPHVSSHLPVSHITEKNNE